MVSENYSERIKTYLSSQFSLPEEQVVTMLPEFKKTLSGHLKNLEAECSLQSLPSLEKAAHTIKGAFLNLGLTECAELAMQIEGAAAENDTSKDYQSMIGQINAIVTVIVDE